ncbi:MAG: acyltransferase family protein, partial [Chloroflexota bacterium]
MRRLWPALALVVVCTLALGIALWSPLEWRGLRHDAAAGAGYVANISFALRKVAYFDQPEEAPFLHLWSLGVEEQFYLLWPCVLLAAWYVARRCRIDRRRTLAATIATLGALSLAWMIWLVQRRSSYAFFFTPTRMWELALGGLIGLRAVDPPPRGRRGWLYGLIGCAVFAAPLAFPGARSGDPLIQSIAPVIGTAFLLEAIRLGSRLPLPGAAATGLAWIGLYSYGWYLWHWPLVEATKLRWHTQDPRYLLGASLLALLIAVGSKRWIEDPVRFRQADSLLGRLPTWVVIAGIVTIVSAALAGAALMEHQALKNPRVRALADIRQAVDAPTIAARCPRSVFEAPCILGDTASPGVVVVAGDSHAEHWLPAVDSAARVLGLRIVTHIKAACPPRP